MLEYIGDWIANIFIIVFIIVAILGGMQMCSRCIRQTSSPVESNEIDSLTKVNSELTNEVNILDSIKNEKVIEVKSLDNDSTLKLFYKLIGK